MFRALRICRVIACGLPLLLAWPAGSAAGAVWMVAPAKPIDQQINDKLLEADTASRQGHHADAARRYSEAYALTTTDDTFRNSEFALDAVIQAATAYRKAYAASNGDVALCRESKALLDSFRAEWEAAGEITPSAVFDELRWVEARLSEVPSEPDDPAPPPPDPGPDEPPDAIEVVPPDPDPDPDPIVDTPARPSRVPAIALLASGAAATATGAILLGVGVPLEGRAAQYRTDTQASPEFMALPPSDEQVTVEYLDRYVDDERRRGVTLMATGGAVLGVGVAAVVVGAVLLARARRTGSDSVATRIQPRPFLRRRQAALGLSLDF